MKSVRVKICGITNIADALLAVEYGADALGFVFYPRSPRAVSPETAAEIIRQLPPLITTVGVFVDESPDEIRRIIDHACLDVVQFHGAEPPEVCAAMHRAIKAIRVRELSDLTPLVRYRVSAFLLDTYCADSFGGTGQTFNWDIAVEAKRFGKVILAGGLTHENIKKAVAWVKPYAVDVSSGVEKEKGRKDPQKLKLFIEKAKSVALAP